MVKRLYNSALAYFKKSTPIEKIFYFSLIMISLYCITTIGAKTVETMESTENPTFVSIKEDIFDDFYANIYDDLFFIKPKNDYEIRLIIKKTEPLRNSNFLDVGSGTGHYVGALTKTGYKIEGIDSSQSMINKARQNYPKCKFTYGDALKSITFQSSSFTHIMCMYFTIYTFNDQLLFFKNCMSWLKPNGYLIFHVVNRDTFDPVLPIANMPYSDKRITTTETSIKNYKYKSDFELNGDNATFTETFTNVQDNSVRKNTHKLFMPTKEVLLSKAKSCGFIFVNITELKEVGYENNFIYILKKK